MFCSLLFFAVASIPLRLSARASAAAPAQSLGAYIKPIAATATDSQSGAGRTPAKMIDGSGWDEARPGSGVYIHTSDASVEGGSMWNGAANSTLGFDLGKTFRVSGVYLWNYNEGGGYNSRSVKEVAISYSVDNRNFTRLGTLTFAMAPGADNYRGEAVRFSQAVSARYFKWEIQSNYRGGEMSGIAEIRFANADVKAVLIKPIAWKPTYPRPLHPKLALGQPLKGAANIVFPTDAGIVDVSKAPYRAKGDGVSDDTAAIQKALDDNPDRGAIIYLPNGVYRISHTLRWGGDDSRQRNTVLQGQSREGTILQLQDRCPEYDNSKKPKACLYTGHAPAQRFFNEIHDLTVDTGVGNPGATGVQFIANNQGGMYDVTIVSGDGQGVNGLDLGYTDEQGPCLIKNIKVQGFDVGIYSGHGVASNTLEHIAVAHQNKFGMRNDGQPCTVRDMRSLNAVPAYRNAAGFQVLTDCLFEGTGAAATLPAVVNDSALMARNIVTRGYRIALQNSQGESREVRGPGIPQFLSKPGVSLSGMAARGMRLPIRETPTIPRDDPSQWIAPTAFGVKPDAEVDASDAIQKAIDSGKSTVYLPRGSYRIGRTVLIRGNVRRIIGLKAYLIPFGALLKKPVPLFRFVDGAAAIVSVEGLLTDFSVGPYCFLEHNAKRALILSRLGVNFQGETRAYRTGPDGTGDLYIEDMVGHAFLFHKQQVWARQFNVEGDGTHVENDGGTLWILGYKTEGGGTLLATRNGGKTELLGGFSYTVGNITDDPMLLIDNAEAAFSFSETCFSGKPFPWILRETRNGLTRAISQSDPKWGGHFTLYTSDGADR